MDGGIFQKDGFDIKKGIEYFGNKEDYFKLLSRFHAHINERASMIKYYEKEEDLPQYTNEVHSLKSTARLIGATKLADMAYELEKYGRAGDIAAIHEHTSNFIEQYLSYIDILQPYVDKQEIIDKIEIDKLKRVEKYKTLYSYIDNYETLLAQRAIDELKTYLLPEEELKLVEKLCFAYENFEYDYAIELLDKLLNN